MRVLVTGAAGFIGAHACREFAIQGHDVVGLDNFLGILYSGDIKRTRADRLAKIDGVTMLERDLRLPLEPALLDGVDAIVNFAALPGLVKSWSHFSDYMAANVLVVENLCRAAVEHRVSHLVHISTSSVYGRNATGDESQSMRPVSPYGVSKLAAEALLEAYAENYDLSFSILRLFSVYGPGQRPDMAYHIICERLLAAEPIEVFGSGAQTRTNTYVRDAVTAVAQCLSRKPNGLKANVAGSQSISVLEAIGILSDELGVEPSLKFSPERPGDQLHTSGDSRLARDVLLYEPTVSIEAGLREQARWHRLGCPTTYLSLEP